MAKKKTGKTGQQKPQTGKDLIDDVNRRLSDEDVEDGLPDSAVSSFKSGADRNGGTEAFGLVLFDDNRKLRRQRDRLRTKVKELEKIIGEGYLLDEDQAEAFEAYVEMGTPEEVKAKIEEGTKNTEALQEERTRNLNADQDAKAKQAGVNLAALRRVAPETAVRFDATKDDEGNEVLEPFAVVEVVKGDSKVERLVPLKEHMEKDDGLKSFIPNVFTSGDEGEGDRTNGQRANGKAGGSGDGGNANGSARGRRVARQSPGDGKPAGKKGASAATKVRTRHVRSLPQGLRPGDGK